jgi:cyclopropane-fatty-acyl-phospholipid synthase
MEQRSQSQTSDDYSVESGAPYVWRGYSAEEDQQRTNLHYDKPPEFFNLITGGEWNVYSANIWDPDVTTDTESQERKLDLLARLMELRPGQRILDVGCGWAGPLVYLTTRYGATGEGLTLSPLQKASAEARISKYNAPVKVHVKHWQDFEDREKFDVVFTDEVSVHFNDLKGYFTKVRGLLKPGGLMLNKELHFCHAKYMELTRAMIHLNKIFGETGNYRMLHTELAWLDETGFRLERIEQMSIRHYERTADAWFRNMTAHRARLEELVGAKTYGFFRTYLRLVRKIHGSTPAPMTCDIVVARPIE